jgi:hypothetical protein
MLPKGQPHPEDHLGSAKDPHPLRLFNEPQPDPTGALGAYHPQPRMLLRSRNSMSPSPTVIIAKASMSHLFHTALFSSLFLCSTKKLADTSFYGQYSQPVRKRQASSATVVSGTRIGEV